MGRFRLSCENAISYTTWGYKFTATALGSSSTVGVLSASPQLALLNAGLLLRPANMSLPYRLILSALRILPASKPILALKIMRRLTQMFRGWSAFDSEDVQALRSKQQIARVCFLFSA